MRHDSGNVLLLFFAVNYIAIHCFLLAFTLMIKPSTVSGGFSEIYIHFHLDRRSKDPKQSKQLSVKSNWI